MGYLEKMHEEEMTKLLVYLKGFTEDQRTRLAQITALWLASGQIPSTILPVLINEHQVKDGTALGFLLELLSTLKSEKGGPAVTAVIKKSGAENRLIEFFPSNNQQQTEENFKRVFADRDLPEVVAFRNQVAAANVRSEITKSLNDAISDEKSVKEIIADVKEIVIKTGVSEHDVVVLIWQSVMTGVEWNKKEELLQDQALRHLKQYLPLFAAFTNNFKSEINLFNKIILLLYKIDILSEDAILKWYKESHSQRGWSVFMDQMKKFIEWLENADEESEEEDDEED